MPSKLTSNERKLLKDCETTLLQHNHAFLAVGQALWNIRQQALYRESYPTFEAYIIDRWDMSRAYAYRLMDAAEVVNDLSPMGDILPSNERQARPLTPLDTSQRIVAWKMIIERASGKRITATLVTEVVEKLLVDWDKTGEPGGGQAKPTDDVFGRITDIRKKLKKMESKPEYVKFCQRTEAKLRKLIDEVEKTYQAAMKDYLGE